MLDGDYKITLGKLREVSLLSHLEQAELCETNLRRDSKELESYKKMSTQMLGYILEHWEPSQKQVSDLQNFMDKLS